MTAPLSGEPLMLPPLKGEGDREAVEGFPPKERESI